MRNQLPHILRSQPPIHRQSASSTHSRTFWSAQTQRPSGMRNRNSQLQCAASNSMCLCYLIKGSWAIEKRSHLDPGRISPATMHGIFNAARAATCPHGDGCDPRTVHTSLISTQHKRVVDAFGMCHAWRPLLLRVKGMSCCSSRACRVSTDATPTATCRSLPPDNECFDQAQHRLVLSSAGHQPEQQP